MVTSAAPAQVAQVKAAWGSVRGGRQARGAQRQEWQVVAMQQQGCPARVAAGGRRW